MSNTKKTAASLSDAKKLTKKISISMAKMVDDLTKLRKATEAIKTNLDATGDEKAADRMYDFYNEVAHLESDIEDAHYSFKEMYEELGGTDVIPDPIDG